MNEFLYILSVICLFLGCIFNLLAGIGLIRFPDLYTRIHATGIAGGLGTGLILIGLMLQSGWDTTLSKLFLILLFTLITSPTASYTLAKSARQSEINAQRDSENRSGGVSSNH